MNNKKKILAISGSTRKDSTNHRLLKAIAEISKNNFDVIFYNELSLIPAFNPDEDNENVAKGITRFRNLIRQSDGVIICTPEYAHGVPGSLKNAIDWTVGTGDFSQKPTLLITASTDGKYGHAALVETLRVIEAKNIGELQLLIPFASTKISNENKISDIPTLESVKTLLNKFEVSMDQPGAQTE
ncbi:MAG TPA: NADPH-dependent FMN reductase [Hanamia sp.]